MSETGILDVEEERIEVKKWLKTHFHGTLNEEHLPTVDISKTILQAEIRPGMFTIIDGNHRIENAFREGVSYLNSYKLRGEQLIPFFRNEEGYRAFVGYWNS